MSHMPALSADWPEVKGTAIATGSLKQAAAHHGVSYDALKMRASREEWPVGRRVHKLAQDAKTIAREQIIRASGGAVTSVTSTADALLSVLSDNKRRTKLAQSSYLVKASEKLDQVADPLEYTDAALQLATMVTKVYPEDHQEAAVSLQFFSIVQDRSSVEPTQIYDIGDQSADAMDDPDL